MLPPERQAQVSAPPRSSLQHTGEKGHNHHPHLPDEETEAVVPGPRSPQRVTDVRPKHSQVTRVNLCVCVLFPPKAAGFKPTVPKAGLTATSGGERKPRSSDWHNSRRHSGGPGPKRPPRAPGATGTGRRSPLSMSWRTLTIKERASACLPGRKPQRWQVRDSRERGLLPPPPTQGRPSDPAAAGCCCSSASGASSRLVPGGSAFSPRRVP